MIRPCCFMILSLVLTLSLLGCDSDMTQMSNPVFEPTTEPVVAEPVVAEPVVAEPVVAEDEAENNFCQVGDVLQPGESCKDGTGDDFTVLENGSGRYLFITAGKGIQLFGNINGKQRNFSAEKKNDGSWEIKSVTPKE